MFASGVVILATLSISGFAAAAHGRAAGLEPSFANRRLLQIAESAEKTKQSFLGDINFGFLPYSMPSGTAFCGVQSPQNFTSLDDCNIEGYATEIGLFAVPGVLLAVLSLLSFCTFVFGRWCCNCCGGRKPSAGCLCGDCCDGHSDQPKPEFPGYSRAGVVLLTVLVIINAVVLMALPIQGFLGNNSFHKGIAGVVSTVDDTFTTLTEKAGDIAGRLQALPYSSDASSTLSEVASELSDSQSTFQNYSGYAVKGDNYRAAVIFGVFGLPVLLGLIAILAALFKVPGLTMCVGLFCFIASFIMWATFAAHLPVSVLFVDVCSVVQAYLGNQTSTGNLPSFLQCSNGTIGPLAALLDDAEDGLNQAFGQICTSANEACRETYCSQSCNSTTAPTFQNSIVEDFGVGCMVGSKFQCPVTNQHTCTGEPRRCSIANVTWAQCAVRCNNADLKTAAHEIVYNLGIAQQYQQLMTTDILPVISCSFVTGIVDDLNDSVCSSMSQGIDGIATSSLIVACLLVPFTFLTIIGSKRFTRTTKRQRQPERSATASQDPDYYEPLLAPSAPPALNYSRGYTYSP